MGAKKGRGWEMMLGFFWGEDEQKRPDGKRVRKSLVGAFHDLPEPVEGGVRVGRVEHTVVTEVIEPSPQAVASDAPKQLPKPRKRLKG